VTEVSEATRVQIEKNLQKLLLTENSPWTKINYVRYFRERATGSNYVLPIPQPSAEVWDHDMAELDRGIQEAYASLQVADTNGRKKLAASILAFRASCLEDYIQFFS
jgi:hypothetical protein